MEPIRPGDPDHPTALQPPSARERKALELLPRVLELRETILALQNDLQNELDQIPAGRRASGQNLVHYLALRQHDIRELQGDLSGLGLSSLGRCEGRVLRAVDSVLRTLHDVAHRPPHTQAGSFNSDSIDLPRLSSPTPSPTSSNSAEPERVLFPGGERLDAGTDLLLGHRPRDRRVRIMVTMPSEAATDPSIIEGLLDAGMDIMRINCAHDGPPQWRAMINTLRAASRRGGRSAKVLMDLPGPKARTGAFEPGPAIVRWNPPRDEIGRLIRPARLWLTSAEHPSPPPAASYHNTSASTPRRAADLRADATIPVPSAFLLRLRRGDTIHLQDRRGKRRALSVRSVNHNPLHPHAWCDSSRSAYVEPGQTLTVANRPDLAATLGELPRLTLPIILLPGDDLILTADQSPARRGTPGHPARVPFTLPEALADVRPGHRIMLDDGKVSAIVREASASEVRITITRCKPDGFRLWPDKGVNLPDSPLHIGALGEDDLACLDFIAANADIVGLSFVRSPADIAALRDELARRNASHLGIVLKIETKAAFDALPALLLAALQTESSDRGGIGVMIARGDLAVEIGYERLAEVQEEILWLCEAAHLPVIWATQVLETLAKKGLPSRSEITDAAMGERAECVMLNKGPYIHEAVRVLDDILRRMSAHQSKKRSMLRPLNIARRFGE